MDTLNRGDDFILPANQDTSQECELISDNHALSDFLPFCGALSIACYLYLFWMYFVLKSPILKRHPTSKFRNLFVRFEANRLQRIVAFCSVGDIQMRI